MNLRLETYRLDDTENVLTPALLIYADMVDANIQAAIVMAGNDPNRWRPHLKTVKSDYILRRLISYGITAFKCATTLELDMACRAGAQDVLMAFPVAGANAKRTAEIASEHSHTRVSILVESLEQIDFWRNTPVGIFIDVNPGMNRTGIDQQRLPEIARIAKAAGRHLRGLHYYDGHMSGYSASERQKHAHDGYTQLMEIVDSLRSAGLALAEVITSGTPAAPHAISFPGFTTASFIHRVSPGTIVLNDLTSLEQLPAFGFAPAALVLSTVVSRPAAGYITCDAGHKSVSADAGVPTCEVIGHSGFTALKPSEEHLPMQIASSQLQPQIGEKLYLLPKHVCPTVNNFDQALLVRGGSVQSGIAITARGHESPMLRQQYQFA